MKANKRENDYFYLYDFAVIQLDTTDNLEEIYGSIGYDFSWIEQKERPILRKEAFLIGYPIDKNIVLTQYSGAFLVDDKVIRHIMPTLGGTSGSPILELQDGEYIVRGIHNAEATKLGIPHRTAMLLADKMYNCIQNFLNRTLLRYNFDGISTVSQGCGIRISSDWKGSNTSLSSVI